MRADRWQFLLKEKDLIYTEKHEGWYSVTDEAFYPESAVQLYLDPTTGRKMMVCASIAPATGSADFVQDLQGNRQ